MSSVPAVLTVADLLDRMADPEWCEAPLTDGDNPLTPVLVVDPSDGEALNGAPPLPWRLLVGLCEDHPLAGPPVGLDVALCEGDEGQGWIRVGRLEEALDTLRQAGDTHPGAVGVLCQITRINESLSIQDGLLAESLAYSGLLGGTEFRAWRDANPTRPTEPSTSPVRIAWEDDAVVIRLNRPEVRNAYDPSMRDALTDALRAVAALPEAAPVRLEGSGPDFCSGGDLSWFGVAEDVVAAHAVRTARSPGPLLAELRATARVHGACIGAGVELPAFCSRVEADPGAWFRLPEIGMGLIPGAGGTVSLLARLGRFRLNWFALSGLPLDAVRALEWGLVDAIVE